MFCVRNGKSYDLGFLNTDTNFVDANESLPQGLLARIKTFPKFNQRHHTPEEVREMFAIYAEIEKWEQAHGTHALFGEKTDQKDGLHGVAPTGFQLENIATSPMMTDERT